MDLKTTMAVMIQGIDTASETYLNGGYTEAYNATIPLKYLALKLIEKEKEQIVNAYKEGYHTAGSFDCDAEIYYNQTYLNDRK